MRCPWPPGPPGPPESSGSCRASGGGLPGLPRRASDRAAGGAAVVLELAALAPWRWTLAPGCRARRDGRADDEVPGCRGERDGFRREQRGRERASAARRRTQGSGVVQCLSRWMVDRK